MPDYKIRLARLLARSGCLFFAPELRLKDGRPSPYFVNLGRLRTGRLSLELGQCFAQWISQSPLADKLNVLVGPSYKGSAIAQAAALALYQFNNQDVAFEYDRKEAKTHGEASSQATMFVTDALHDGAHVLIVDDVGTSMATKLEILQKLRLEEQRQAFKLNIQGIVLAVDREQTQAVYDSQGQVVLGVKGSDAWAEFERDTGIALYCLLGIRELLDILHTSAEPVQINGRMQPLCSREMELVHDYLHIYGR